MMRNIVVPLDGSAFAESALGYAAEIARRTRAALHLVHVHSATAVEGVPVTQEDKRWDVTSREREQEYLDDAAARVAGATGASVSGHLLDGPVIKALADFADGVDAELVVMTTHGRGGFERAWLGSVADHAVRHLTRPILLVRAAEVSRGGALDRRPSFQRFLVPLDGSNLAERVLDPALELGTAFDSDFTLLRVVQPPLLPAVPYTAQVSHDPNLIEQLRAEADAYLDRVADRIRARSRPVDARTVIAETTASTILHHASEVGADLIAMSTHGRGGVLRLLLGSVADKVLRGAPVPVLLYRA